MDAQEQMISWGTIYKALRDTLPAVRYHDGQPVTALTPAPRGATVHVGDAAHAVDLAIIADGSASRHRGLVAPEGASRYAGYVAYRGVIDEADLPHDLAARFRDRFSFYDANRTRFLCYFIPGDFGTTTPGRRRMNWVWYVRSDAPELSRITTDRNGIGHGLSLLSGLIGPMSAPNSWSAHGRHCRRLCASWWSTPASPSCKRSSMAASPRCATTGCC
ncbi:hypothetical protein ABZ915_39910 [Streptomyces sp. NPDC046915]|uniref:FAD binding domain-containing protein n=1 Tax=Streptomyces sp. NPDC046915 TaxID=3155257 RepID=UPI0033C2D24D